MEKYENGFSGNEKSLGIFELQNDTDDINTYCSSLVFWYTPRDYQAKRHNLKEYKTTKLSTYCSKLA